MKSNHTTSGKRNIFAELKVPNAENLKLRSELMIAIAVWVRDSGLTQADAAKRLKTTQPILNNVIKGQYEKFTIDRLIKMLDAAGMQVSLSISRAA